MDQHVRTRVPTTSQMLKPCMVSKTVPGNKTTETKRILLIKEPKSFRNLRLVTMSEYGKMAFPAQVTELSDQSRACHSDTSCSQRKAVTQPKTRMIRTWHYRICVTTQKNSSKWTFKTKHNNAMSVLQGFQDSRPKQQVDSLSRVPMKFVMFKQVL